MKRTLAILLTLVLAFGLLAGCGSSAKSAAPESSAQPQVSAQPEKKAIVIGDTTFNPENSEPDVNPHNDYAGWPCIRYGIGETLSSSTMRWR